MATRIGRLTLAAPIVVGIFGLAMVALGLASHYSRGAQGTALAPPVPGAQATIAQTLPKSSGAGLAPAGDEQSPGPAAVDPASPAAVQQAIAKKVAAMSLHSKIGQTMMVGIPESWSLARPGILGEIAPGSVILYKRNVTTRARLVSLIGNLQAAAGRLSDVRDFIAIDHEGGRVNRLPHGDFTAFPNNRDIGQRSDAEEYVKQEAAVMAQELTAVGIQIDLAPVVDVCSNPDNPDIKDRSYGPHTQRVANLGSAFIRSALDGGLFVVAKHFPGYGPIANNPHEKLPEVGLSRAQWDANHRPPFQAAIDAGVPGVMTGHVVYPALDASETPASLSPKVCTDLLRGEMHFQGLIFTDDLEMGAITTNYGVGSAAVKAMAAGADVLLVCHSLGAQHHVISALTAAVKSGLLPEERLNDAVGRILWYKYYMGLWQPK